MKGIVLIAATFLCSIQISGQFGTTAAPQPLSSTVFQYDEAGNQIFRGIYCPNCPLGGNRTVPEGIETPIETFTTDDEFLKNIYVYPVPVRDVLTISWTEKEDDLITEIGMYEQSTVHWKFQQQNLPSLNRELKIDMSGYYMGVYIVTFRLKDGRTVSKNITKF